MRPGREDVAGAAVARAAAQAGKANGATLVTGRRGWDDQGVLVESAKRGRWVIFDELDRADLDGALGELSSFLAGLPVLLAGGDEAAPGWRLARRGDGGAGAECVGCADAALRRRRGAPPAGDVLVAALNVAARGPRPPPRRGAAMPLAEIAPLGARVFIDAARHAARPPGGRPADEATLARDAFAAYVALLLGDLDAAAAAASARSSATRDGRAAIPRAAWRRGRCGGGAMCRRGAMRRPAAMRRRGRRGAAGRAPRIRCRSGRDGARLRSGAVSAWPEADSGAGCAAAGEGDADVLGFYPKPVNIDRVRIVHVAWLFRLPGSGASTATRWDR